MTGGKNRPRSCSCSSPPSPSLSRRAARPCVFRRQPTVRALLPSSQGPVLPNSTCRPTPAVPKGPGLGYLHDVPRTGHWCAILVVTLKTRLLAPLAHGTLVHTVLNGFHKEIAHFSPEPNPCRTRLPSLALRSAWRSVPSRSHASIHSKTSNVAVIAVDVAGVSEASPVTGGTRRSCDLSNCCCFIAANYNTRPSSSPDPSPPALNDFPMIYSLDGELIPTVPSCPIPPAVGTKLLST